MHSSIQPASHFGHGVTATFTISAITELKKFNLQWFAFADHANLLLVLDPLVARGFELFVPFY